MPILPLNDAASRKEVASLPQKHQIIAHALANILADPKVSDELRNTVTAQASMVFLLARVQSDECTPQAIRAFYPLACTIIEGRPIAYADTIN